MNKANFFGTRIRQFLEKRKKTKEPVELLHGTYYNASLDRFEIWVDGRKIGEYKA